MALQLETRIREFLAKQGLEPTRWTSAASTIYERHEHPYGKILFVVEGSITFTVHLRDGKRQAVVMKAGDRLDLPPGTPHSAVVGREGVACLEAQRTA